MNTKPRTREAELRALYAKLPEVHCKGYCANPTAINVCSVVTLSKLELNKIEDRVGRENLKLRDLRICPLLKDGRCSAYDLRPLICRLYGAVESMTCPFGCRPDEGSMSNREATALLDESVRIGGRPSILGHNPFLELSAPAAGAAVSVRLRPGAPDELIRSIEEIVGASIPFPEGPIR